MAIEKKEVETFDIDALTAPRRNIGFIGNWCEWLTLYQAARTYRDMVGLLHDGLGVRLEHMQFEEKKYDQIDRLTFYFKVAHGWADEHLLELPEDRDRYTGLPHRFIVAFEPNGNPIQKTLAGMRQEVARKAFEILCTSLFKLDLKTLDDGGDSVFHHEWQRTITSERLFPVIQNFFKVEKGDEGSFIVQNLIRSRWGKLSHQEEQVVSFLLNLNQFLWEWKEPYIWSITTDAEKEKSQAKYAVIRARIDGAKPWMITLLSRLDKLDVLNEHVMAFDDVCVARLQEIALDTELSPASGHPVSERRPIKTIEEACYVGSPAAWLLKRREVMLAEHQKLREVLEVEQSIEESRQRLAELIKK